MVCLVTAIKVVMRVVRTVAEVRESVSSWRDGKQHIAFVPTMGNLHPGHISLVEIARKIADKVVVSIFVNPRQFDDEEDFATYPQTASEDIQALRSATTDLVFMPPIDEVFSPAGFDIVSAGRLGNELCGKFRPGHFDGMATVVVRLFKIVRPHIAVFGRKDYQQLCIVKNLVRDFGFDIEIVDAPTIRMPQGLALSSRNSRLTSLQIQQASAVYRTLQGIAAGIRASDDAGTLIAQALDGLRKDGFRPEYIEVRKADTLSHVATMEERPLVILAAAWLGKARLIDNLTVE